MATAADTAEATTSTLVPEPTEVKAETPAKRTRKPAEPKEPKAPRDVRDPGGIKEDLVVAGYTLPSDDELKKLTKSQMRQVIRKQGKVPVGLANYLTPRELRFVIQDAYPFESNGYGFDGVNIKNYKDALKLYGDRAEAYTEREKGRSEQRTALRRETLGELAEQYRDNPTELIRSILGDRTWIPVRPQDGPRRVEEGDRFYDIDGRAGRKTFYEFVPEGDMKADGKTPKAAATVIKISPQVLEGKILEDKEFAERFNLPEGFGAKPEPKPRGRKAAKPQAIEDSLATMEVDNGHPGSEATDLDDILAPPAAAPAETTEDEVALPEL